MESGAALINKFYGAFQRKDFRTMQECYHPAARFSDPAFPDLSSDEVNAMWEMLLKASTDLKLEYNNVQASEEKGSCVWQAWYTFTSTGRKVHNIIHAEFEFRDGLIYRHKDHFNFWRWSRMALGASGLLLGWTPFLRAKVQSTAKARLNSFINKKQAAAS